MSAAVAAPTYYAAGRRLLAARRDARLMQWEVALKSDVPVKVLSLAENGRRPLAPYQATAVAPLVGLTAAELLEADPEAAGEPVPAAAADAPVVQSHRDVPALCRCDWQQLFRGGRTAGWALARLRAGCPATAFHRKAAAA